MRTFEGFGLCSFTPVADPAIEAVTGLGAGATLGVSAAVEAAIALINHYVGEGRKTANTLTQGLQQDFTNSVLAPLAVVNQADPAQAHALMEKAWPTFLQQAQSFADQGGNQAKVVAQMLTPGQGFLSTVTSILGRNPFPNGQPSLGNGKLSLTDTQPTTTTSNTSDTASQDAKNAAIYKAWWQTLSQADRDAINSGRGGVNGNVPLDASGNPITGSTANSSGTTDTSGTTSTDGVVNNGDKITLDVNQKLPDTDITGGGSALSKIAPLIGGAGALTAGTLLSGGGSILAGANPAITGTSPQLQTGPADPTKPLITGDAETNPQSQNGTSGSNLLSTLKGVLTGPPPPVSGTAPVLTWADIVKSLTGGRGVLSGSSQSQTTPTPSPGVFISNQATGGAGGVGTGGNATGGSNTYTEPPADPNQLTQILKLLGLNQGAA